MAQGTRNQDKMSEKSLPPIVNDAKLPRMDETEQLTVDKSSPAGENEMQSSLEKAQSSSSKQKGNFMKPFKPPGKPEKVKKELPPEDSCEPQKEDHTAHEKESQDEGYIRFQLRVENDGIKIIEVRSVEGPLLQEESVHGELGFEMRLADRRLALGSIPDSGEMRSFPPPHPTEGMHGHHITEKLDYEFAVRIPRQQFTEDDTKSLVISVFRKKGNVDFKCLSPDKSVLVQSDNLRSIANLTGMSKKTITKEARNQINLIMQK